MSCTIKRLNLTFPKTSSSLIRIACGMLVAFIFSLLQASVAQPATSDLQAIIGEPHEFGEAAHTSTLLQHLARTAQPYAQVGAAWDQRTFKLPSSALPNFTVQPPFKFDSRFGYELGTGNSLTIDATRLAAIGATIFNFSTDRQPITLIVSSAGSEIGRAVLPYNRWIVAGAAAFSGLSNVTITASGLAYASIAGSRPDSQRGFWTLPKESAAAYCRAYYSPPVPVLVGWEAVQVIQDWSNSVPLIVGKRTVLRTYWESSDPAVPLSVTAEIEALDEQGRLLSGSPQGPDNRSVLAAPGAVNQRTNIDGSLNFTLPSEWTLPPKVTIRILMPQPPSLAFCHPDAPAPANLELPLEFIKVPALPIKLSPVKIQDNVGNSLLPEDRTGEDILNYSLAVFPVANIDRVLPSASVSYTAIGGLDPKVKEHHCTYFARVELARINYAYLSEQPALYHAYFMEGFNWPQGSKFGGFAWNKGPFSAALSFPDPVDHHFSTHELAHSLGVHHPVTQKEVVVNGKLRLEGKWGAS